MKDFKDLMEYVLKNKYVIICVAIVLLLYALGVIEFITKFIVLLFLVALAIYIGKKIQDNEWVVKKLFNFKGFRNDDNVYYYQEKQDKNNNKK
jgi:uncharacterized membrane protein